MGWKICCICLQQGETLNPFNSPDNDPITIKQKLEYLVPEKEWLEVDCICRSCSSQLDQAYKFKHFCLNTNLCGQQNTERNGITEYTATNTCKETFETKEAKCAKQEAKPSNRTLKFQCEICKESFHFLKNIFEHCTSAHSMNKKDIKPYKCSECNSKFHSSSLLIQHKKYHAGVRYFVCSSCGKTFITKRDLTAHEKVHDNHRLYNCKTCNKSFNTSQNLKTHIYVVHTDSSQWKYSCIVCTKKFAMKANWMEHVKRHEGNKNYSCDICRKSFVSNYEVRKHIRLHSNIAPHKCEHCEKRYRGRRSLNLHLAKAHGIGSVKSLARAKKFTCHICSRQFFVNAKLQKHLQTHKEIAI